MMDELPHQQGQHPEREAGREPGAEEQRARAPEQLRATGLASAVPPEWSGGEMYRASEVEMHDESQLRTEREPLFSRRVIIGWAALTLIAYFSFHLVGRVVKESVRQAIVSNVHEARSNSGRRVIIMLPNGKRIVISNSPATSTGPRSPSGIKVETLPPASEIPPALKPAQLPPTTPRR